MPFLKECTLFGNLKQIATTSKETCFNTLEWKQQQCDAKRGGCSLNLFEQMKEFPFRLSERNGHSASEWRKGLMWQMNCWKMLQRRLWKSHAAWGVEHGGATTSRLTRMDREKKQLKFDVKRNTMLKQWWTISGCWTNMMKSEKSLASCKA